MPSSTESDLRGTQRHDQGQAAVEFAAVLPVVVVMAIGLVVVGVAVRNELAVHHAAREGARAASVSATPSAAASGAAGGATSLPVEVTTSHNGTSVSVTVTYTDPVDVAIIGALLGPITHTATVTMALEPP